jgi:hypothetical protein
MTAVFADTFYFLALLDSRVMHDDGLTGALTGDKHFEQAGLTALLKRAAAGFYSRSWQIKNLRLGRAEGIRHVHGVTRR